VSLLHVLRVFGGADGRGGNPLGVFVNGTEIEPERRQAVAAELGFSETVFVDAIADGVARIAIFTPAAELPFAGHPTVGTGWLLRELGTAVETLRCRAGDVAVWADGELAWIRARAAWVHAFPRDRLATPAEVDAVVPPAMGERGRYVWAWEDEPAGRVRARYFPTDLGIAEDEATGAAAVVMGAELGRSITIRQGVGSELHVRPGPDGTIEVGGRVELVERRTFGQ
jgi:predicted PhzF superfamily epimerase YddE/YHI9